MQVSLFAFDSPPGYDHAVELKVAAVDVIALIEQDGDDAEDPQFLGDLIGR